MRQACPRTLALLAALLPGPVRAQFPQARLQAVAPPGGRAGQTVDVTLTGANLDGVKDLWFDHPGLRAFHRKGTTFRVAIAPGTPPGPHDLRAVGPLGATNARTFVVGDRPERPEVEPNNERAQATPIALDSVAVGAVGPVDIDCFAFDGRRGQAVVVEVASRSIDGRLDPMLRLFGPDDATLAEAGGGPDPEPALALTLPADGRYVIQLHDVIYAGSPEHLYRLTLRDGPRPEAIAPAVAPPGLASAFSVFGTHLGPGTGSGLRVDDRTLERREVIFALPASAGTDPVRDGPLPSALAGRRGASYRATASSNPLFVAEATDPIVLEREPNDADHAQGIPLPCDIAGAFGAAGDLDVYRFRARKGDVWWIEATAERLGSPADPTLVVQRVPEKGDPQDVASADDLTDPAPDFPVPGATVDAVLRWPVPEDGLYQVVIHDIAATQRGDPRFTYRLNIRPARPDFVLFVVPANPAQDGAPTVRAGGRATARVAAWRRDGFDRPIRVEALDGPPGVSCDPVVIGPGQFQAPLVFRAEPTARPGVAVVRVIGRALAPDRKEVLDYVRGTDVPRPELVREALAAEATGPPGNINGVPIPAPTRLVQGVVLAVRPGAPFELTATPETVVVAPGGTAELNVEVVRRAGFAEAVSLSTADLPPNLPGASATIAKEKTSAVLKLTVPANVPPGLYTILVRGTGPFPFQRDPDAKDRPTITVNEPSNPITLSVRK